MESKVMQIILFFQNCKVFEWRHLIEWIFNKFEVIEIQHNAVNKQMAWSN